MLSMFCVFSFVLMFAVVLTTYVEVFMSSYFTFSSFLVSTTLARASVIDIHSNNLFRAFVCMSSSSVCSCSVLYQVYPALNWGMYKLWIHEPSSELIKITQVSCGDFDICIYFKTLFLVNVHMPER